MYFFLKKQKKAGFCFAYFTISFCYLLRQSKPETYTNIGIRRRK
jgi:hypothetical protein